FQMQVTELDHTGRARITSEISQLDTESEANLSLGIDSTNYLESTKVKLSALIDMDLDEKKYTFLENTGYINQLPLEFEGYFQQLEDSQEMDIAFKNPESSFKSFLGILPEAYSKNFDKVETTGDFVMNGRIYGENSEARIPNIDIQVNSNNASFKYPNLPKSVSDIIIDMQILNSTGNVDDTYVNLETFNFRIDQDQFRSSAVIRELNKNMKVNAQIEGTVNLANISKAYPIEMDQQLSGILKGNINTNFDMDAVENNAYQRINSSGNVTIRDMVFSAPSMPQPVQINSADMVLSPAGNVSLNNFKGQTGKSDFSASGTINNLIGFILSDKGLQGNFNLNSSNIHIDDFMDSSSKEVSSGEKSTGQSAGTEPMKIPDFLNCNINISAQNVHYDNLVLNDVKGTVVIRDQQASLQNVTSTLFDGILALKGDVSTQTDIPVFNIDLAADSFSLSKSFNNLELLQQLAPIANALNGKLNTTISLSGSLNEEFSPNLQSLRGSAFAELLTTAIDPQKSPVLNQLGGALNFIDFSKLDLKDLKANLDFSDGLVRVKPFNFKYQDIEIVVSGNHSFDNNMEYTAIFNVPAKYLGSEVNRLIGKINDNEVNKIVIPVAAKITGSFSSPKVTTDLSSGVANLTKQLIEIEKQKLLNSGRDKITELLGGIAKPKSPVQTKEVDSTSKDSTVPVIKTPSIIKNDTVITKKVDEKLKDVLGGLIKKRKETKPETPPEKTPDSIN
ncbi:MAG: AsmA-like C-terminal region-containing protein, partial [Flavobacteriaceae bacterium]|nr:AsmA-like C-terminal region-containing protein [Flavobacteriaceae bacterium]